MCQIWGYSFHNARNPPIWPVAPIQTWTRVTRWTPKDPTAARTTGSLFGTTLQRRHNERNGVSNHRRLDCLPSRLFMRRSKTTSKLRVTGLCEGNSPVTGEFPAVTGEFPAQKPVTRNTNGTIEMRSPSAAAMLTMVAAATIVRFPPVLRQAGWFHLLNSTLISFPIIWTNNQLRVAWGHVLLIREIKVHCKIWICVLFFISNSFATYHKEQGQH